jgi:hypothetical protein
MLVPTNLYNHQFGLEEIFSKNIIIWASNLVAQLPKDELIHFCMLWCAEQ